jgi:hypothetical protein
LLLKRASASRPSGDWNDDDFDVLADGAVVGRIFNLALPSTRVLIKSRLFGNRWLPRTTCASRQGFISDAVATSQEEEDHRSPRSGRAARHRPQWYRKSRKISA